MKSSFVCVIVLFHSFAQKTNAYELSGYMASNVLIGGDPPPRFTEQNTNSYLVCARKTGVSSDTILSIRGGDWKEGDQKAKAWVQCVLRENELMTDQSVFRLDVAFKYLTGLERKLLEANIDKCLPIKAMQPTEIQWQFAKCFQTADPENTLF